MVRAFFLSCGLALLAGCVAPPTAPTRPAAAVADVPLDAREAARNFVAVVDRVEPVAEQFCRAMRADRNCNYGVYVDPDPKLPPNAGQTLDPQGNPAIIFTISLVMEARSQDELALILGHEAAHHIAGHLDRSQSDARRGALIFGTAAALGGADQKGVAEAQRMGAELGARRYSKDHELEADDLGARIAYAAGYDPIRGLAYFTRSVDPGDQFLGTHPPNARRIARVTQVVRELEAGGA